MANLTVTAISFPKTYNSTLAAQVAVSGPGLPPPGASSLNANGGVFNFANGSTGADVLPGATLAAILPDGPLKSLLNTVFTDIPAGDNAATQFQKAALALGLEIAEISGASGISPNCVSGQRPQFDVTTTGPTGILRAQLTASIAA